MTQSQKVLTIKLAAWILVALFVAASGAYGAMTYGIVTDKTNLGYCGNVITDPLHAILNYILPVAAFGAGALWRLQKVSLGSRKLAHSAVWTVSAIGVTLVGFGTWVHRVAMPGTEPLSSSVWWIPFL